MSPSSVLYTEPRKEYKLPVLLSSCSVVIFLSHTVMSSPVNFQCPMQSIKCQHYNKSSSASGSTTISSVFFVSHWGGIDSCHRIWNDNGVVSVEIPCEKTAPNSPSLIGVFVLVLLQLCLKPQHFQGLQGYKHIHETIFVTKVEKYSNKPDSRAWRSALQPWPRSPPSWPWCLPAPSSSFSGIPAMGQVLLSIDSIFAPSGTCSRVKFPEN